MNYYAIGIGGTGAKCVDALTHLSAAGMMPDGELYSLFVDPDKSNGCLERAQTTLQRYIDCKTNLRLGGVDLFKTRIVRAKPDVWSPFGDEPRPRLDNFFEYSVLKAERDKAPAHLFDVLYTRAEKETELDMGFRGRPSIGAAVMTRTGAAVIAKRLNLRQGEPWQTFRDRIARDGRAGAGAKIFLFASIFGGTGAAGFPTIARLICNELEDIGREKVKIGGALVLPYFSFISESDDNTLKADAKNFLMITQVALKYYRQRDKTDDYDAVYLLGDETLSNVDFCKGAGGQRNKPHFIELYAALAAIDFFKNERARSRYYMLARQQRNRLEWNYLPDDSNGNLVKQRLGQLARFAFAYLGVYQPALDEIQKYGKSYRFPWFVDFFERRNISVGKGIAQTSLGQLGDYCKSFLQWLDGIQTSAEDENINLANHRAFADLNLRLSEFDNLILPLRKEDPDALSKLWERMCDAEVSDNKADGIGRFVHALYRECAE